MNKMMKFRKNFKYIQNYNFPPTKLRNVFCTQCKHQFFFEAFVPMRGTIPLLLDCGHIICDKCAKSFVNQSCPICNIISEYDNNNIPQLPLNIYALGLMVMSHNRPINRDEQDISFFKPSTSKSKQQGIQGLCSECGIQATLKCQQCNVLFCHICYSKIHGKALQNHSKVMLTEENSENSFILRNTCSEQCLERIGYYCENCDIAACSHCMIQLHKKHNYFPLSQQNNKLMTQFYNVFDRVSENLKRVQQVQKKLISVSSTSVEEIQNIASIEATVTQHFAYLHGVLQNTEQQIIDMLQEYINFQNKNINEIFTQLKEYEERLQSAILISTSIQNNLDQVDIQQVIKKLEPMANIPCYLVENTDKDNKIEFNINNNIIKTIKQHCYVYVPKASIYSLQQKDLLPKDYEIEPLVEETVTSLENKETSPDTKPNIITNDGLTDIGSSEMVNVTHIVDPSCFYVQIIQNQQKISDLSKGLATLATTTGTIPTEVTLNALYIAQCSKHNVWYRARVIEKKTNMNDDERYSLFFIDYGMKEENVPLSRIRNIIPQFAMLPVMALRCTLFDIVPNNGKWHPDATRVFKKLVCTNSVVSMCIKMITGDTYYVDLCVISSKDSGLISVKDSLTYMKYGTCISPNTLMRMNPDSTRKYFKEVLDLEIYSNVEILFVESPSCIYVQRTHTNKYTFHKMQQEMVNDYERNISTTDYIIFAPCKDLPCAARGVDGYWHRGLIREVTENTIKVFYVDLGYTLVLSYDAIRALPRKYMSCRTQAVRVSLRNIKPRSNNKNQWEPETKEFIKKFLMDMKSNFKVIPYNQFGDTYNVAMFTLDNSINVADLLVQKWLATYIISSPHNTTMATFDLKTKKKPKKDISCLELSDQYYNNPINENMKKVIEENEDPFKIKVQIHQVQSPDNIYVSDAACDQSDVELMIKQMQEFYSKYRPAKQDIWTKGATCAVYFTRSDMYYRGRIVNIKSNDTVVVFLYDIGVEETVSTNDIQPLYPLFSKISTYVFKIKLTGILPCGGSTTWPSLSCEKLREIIDNNQTSKFYISKLEDEDMEDSAIPVELWIKEVKMDGPLAPTRYEINSINRMLVEKGVALPVKEYAKKRDKILAIELKRQLMKKFERLTKYESSVKWLEINNCSNEPTEITATTAIPKSILYHLNSDSNNQIYENMEEILGNVPKILSSTWLPVEPINEDTFIAIPTYLDHSGFLYLHSKTGSSKILEYIEMKLEKMYSNRSIELCDTVWAVGDPCIAQYHVNKKWYRGKIVEIQGNDIINVEFVDYGNIEQCTTEDLKKKVILEDIPIQCTKCLIEGLNPGTESGMWATEDLDRIHKLLVEQECEVTITYRSEKYLNVSLKILPNKYCRKKTDLITFLINEWEMNIKPNIETIKFQNRVTTNVTTDVTSDVVIENPRSFSLGDDAIKNPVITGNSVLLPDNDTDTVHNIDNDTVTDVENVSWFKLKTTITSTPNIASQEDLSMHYKLINIPNDIDYIEIEMCCCITPTTFYAQLKENIHCTILNTYYTQYELLMNDLQENADKQPLITKFTVNTPCCAKFNDNLWYRCLITESEPIINSDNIEIKLLYVDYGNDEYRKVNSQQCELYTLKKEWIEIPTIAMKCKLWNVEVVSIFDHDKLVSQLEKMYNKRVIAKIKETDEEFMSVELYEDEKCGKVMYNTLIEEGLFEVRSKKN
ncbi:RING finger protein 17 isoform X1 [Bombus pyrosoma]|uniref:RING finger protein 17 isoform X1 n=3 Tax=Bombus pyrosoma TaxID=396416 RepID=UPI001CB9060E|nr:RING finger protein 17 isoform X1 [Bombus pyrosoma]XP_043590615.1 RING finger protein 17 isoform X1 [Bombus pyrosoma]XP_043590616.1 RING finger protein 17 isoform X1 [Bombus pyrosoma]XP_043590617.1 RING finger protein 17 isoform X1 [Bombus pyrosoma]XP_043590618.1 RING finger protein 17 isoform X1 [Bombus pyrosoma]XP_043590619.1 RING finger protein 17 isoform X1 [Bombus pyrosoma]XP_043590620.1 RING finger protein 17 isoform X1 [Bombus pyrosoma]